MDRTETVKTQMKAGEKQYNHDEWIERKTGNKTNDVKKKRQRSQRRQSHIRILRYLEVPKILNSTKQTIYVCTCACTHTHTHTCARVRVCVCVCTLQ